MSSKSSGDVNCQYIRYKLPFLKMYEEQYDAIAISDI